MSVLMMNLLAPLLLLTCLSGARADGPIGPLTADLVPPGTDYGLKQPAVEDPRLFQGKRVAILASHGVEETELEFPYTYLTARGAQVDILVPWWTPNGIVTSNFVKNTGYAKASGTFRSALQSHAKYDLLVLTGGAWNAQVVSMDDEAKALVREHFLAGRPLAAICKGTEILIRFDIARQGITVTGPDYARLNLINSGATFLDKPAVIDCERLLTSRGPSDLVEFVNGLKTLLLRP